jgi:hypothetical protein
MNKYMNVCLTVIHVEFFELLDAVDSKSLPWLSVVIPSGGDEPKQP